MHFMDTPSADCSQLALSYKTGILRGLSGPQLLVWHLRWTLASCWCTSWTPLLQLTACGHASHTDWGKQPRVEICFLSWFVLEILKIQCRLYCWRFQKCFVMLLSFPSGLAFWPKTAVCMHFVRNNCHQENLFTCHQVVFSTSWSLFLWRIDSDTGGNGQ